MKNINKMKKDFRRDYYNLILEFYKFIRDSKLVGTIETAEITESVKVKTRGESNLDKFLIKNNIADDYGEAITLMQFDVEFKPEKIAVDFIVWRTDKFGSLLTTLTNMEDIIKRILERGLSRIKDRLNLILLDPMLEDIILLHGKNWIILSTYKDFPGTVSPIFSYYDSEERGTISIYLNGMYAVDNVESGEMSVEEVANHLMGEIRREYFRRKYGNI